MKIIKPMQQGFMSRTFVKDKRFYLSVSSLSFFPFHNPTALATEQEMWETISTACYKEMVFDLCMPKVRGEVLMIGKCHAPSHEPARRLFVDLDFGPIVKRVVVTGDRFWTRGDRQENILRRLVGHDWRMSDPKSFLEMDIGWRNALGGEAFPENPQGKGYLPPGTSPYIDHSSPLPNVERPERMMSVPESVAEPAGYGPIDVTWPQRAQKSGKKYDKKWERERYPEPAVDMDPTYYNAAPEDQQLKEGFWTGDEAFVITHMHPDHPRQESALPRVRPRCFALQRLREKERWQEIPLHPETVWLFPNIEQGILVSRGVMEVETFYAVDVDTLLLAWELKDGERRLSEAYRNSVKLREDEETSSDWMAREDDLSPPEGIPEEPDILAGQAEKEDGEAANRDAARLQERAEGFLGKAREMLAKAGINPADYLFDAAIAMTPVGTPPNLRKMSDVGKMLEWSNLEIANAEKEAAAFAASSSFGNITTQEHGRRVIEERARKICNRMGQDYDKLQAAAAKDPPSDKSMLTRARELIMQTKAKADDNPEKAKALNDAIKRIDEVAPQIAAAEDDPDLAAAVRENAHYLDPPEMPSPERSAYLREWVKGQHQKGESCATEDLSGVDLSGLDLGGVDFKGAKLDSANLTHANLAGADLSEATLARADLSECILIGADLTKAGLGKATFVRADLTKADLTESAIHLTTFTAANLTNAMLKVGMCQESDFTMADLSGAELSQAQMMKSTLEKAKLCRAVLIKTSFVECRLIGTDFTAANLEEASFIEVDAKGAVFTSARMKNANAHLDSKFVECNFTHIDGEAINFGKTNLVGANFSDAALSKAAFGESSLNWAVLDRVIARESDFTDADLSDARFEQADLMNSSLQGTMMRRTRFIDAHLFAADLLHARMEETDFRGAVVTRTLLEE
jgi:uncharacterized protein YjbI with pentapeptide repeats